MHRPGTPTHIPQTAVYSKENRNDCFNISFLFLGGIYSCVCYFTQLARDTESAGMCRWVAGLCSHGRFDVSKVAAKLNYQLALVTSGPRVRRANPIRARVRDRRYSHAPYATL